MWEFHHPLRPHLSDFRINIGSKKIPSNREVIYSISPVISNYLSRYPNNDFFSISLNELNKDTDINFKKLDIKILSCLFLGLNFHVNQNISKLIFTKFRVNRVCIFRRHHFFNDRTKF